MIQEDKQLLLKDLCGRIYYRPKGVLLRTAFDNEEIEIIGYDGHFIDFFRKGDYDQALIDTIRPYLRPMLSMTAEEKQSYYKLIDNLHFANGSFYSPDIKDWLDEHFFDYRGLIEMRLALEAPENMYKND